MFFRFGAIAYRTKIEFKHVRKKGSAKIEFRMDLGSIFGGFGAPKSLRTTSEIQVQKTSKIECPNELPGGRKSMILR